MKAPEVLNFGCRLNAYEAQVMRDQVQTAGLRDAVIINTCAVTNEAVRQARQAIRKARRQRPEATIVVTGCAAQLEPDAFAAMDEVDRVLGNQEKLRGENFVTPLDGKILVDEETEGVQVNALIALLLEDGEDASALEGA